ncbi:SIR2 family protein [Vibrio ruber]|uniref:SIR2 family protein n=1 Tax=Vibrio ruber TaxID=184755 RepID=UPI0028934613|nr:SIR2 family protein [Vibrio ruber]WNJ95435.1 SIR2 family protein [Vibrio ruber]
MLKKGLDLSKIKLPEVDWKLLESRLATGNAILFTGAGFSLNCINLSGNHPPLAKKLSHLFSEYLGISENDDLKYTSEMSLKYGEKSDVLEILSQQYFLTSTSSAAVQICSIPWRRIYTTNYDNSIELAYSENKKHIDSISLVHKTYEYIKGDRQACVHINGSIQNAVEDDLNNKIKLTDSSYLSGDFFLNTEWRSVFNKDLDHCSAIIFVGYSLYDADIEKVLHENPSLAGKTYFITHTGAEHQDTYKLSNYGYVSTIGTEGFGKFVSEITYEDASSLMPESFTQVEVSYDYESANLDDFATKNLLLYGQYDHQQIDTALRSSFTIPFMFQRSAMTEIGQEIKTKNHVLIQSELGNGKSVLMDQIASSLVMDGITVWKLTNFDANPCKDLDLLSLKGQHVLLIDDIADHKEFFKYFSAIQPNNITFLLSDRTLSSYSNVKVLSESNIDISVYTLDKLSDEEMKHLINILEDQNLWKQYTGWSFDRKIDLLTNTYHGQLSNILLGLLNSPDIKNRVHILLSNLLKNEFYKKTLFAICLCDIFGIRKESSYIADIAGNEEIRKASFRNEEGFKSLFLVGSDNSIISKSSILCLFIVNNYLTESYIVDNCLEIMKRVDGSDLIHLKRLHSRLRTFHNIEKLIPQKQNALNNYFVQLKRNCTWLREHPHYWVQYAMCRLSFGDTDSAQQHLDSAYKFAAKRSDSYHTENIDTQQARLYLVRVVKLSEDISTVTLAFELFQKAHSLLCSIKDDEHKYRQVIRYKEAYESLYDNLNKGKQVKFEHACRNMLKMATESKDFILQTQRIHFLHMSISILTKILEDILIKRNNSK